MASKPSRLARNRRSFPLSLSITSPLIGFSLVMFIITLADAVMSYVAPVYFQESTQNSFLMGLLIASSSVVGLVFDFLIGKWFGHRHYKFFITWTIIVGLTFPVTLGLLPPHIIVFLLSMFFWGIYYEFMEFSNFHFIHEYMSPKNHAKSWGTLYGFRSAGVLVGPLIAGALITTNFNIVFLASFIFFLIGLFSFSVFINTIGKQRKLKKHKRPKQKSIIHEFKIWGILIKKIWPVWLFTLAIYLIDATFWSVGAVLSENLRHISPLGGLLLSIYMLPFLFAGSVTHSIGRFFGKRNSAFLAGLFNGVFLTVAGFIQSLPLLLILIFISATFTAIAIPEILAVAEDYVSRLGKFGTQMVGLDRSAVSLAYIIGPAAAGGIAVLVGHQKTFSIMGGFLMFISIIAFIFSQKKVHLPQKQLAKQR